MTSYAVASSFDVSNTTITAAAAITTNHKIQSATLVFEYFSIARHEVLQDFKTMGIEVAIKAKSVEIHWIF